MKQFELIFTDYVDGTRCTRTLEADDNTARGLLLFRDKYAKNPAQVIAPDDEASLLAAFCTGHDTITDHIIERCAADFDYLRRLTDRAAAALSAQGMDWTELCDGKYRLFRSAAEAGTLEDCRRDFNAFVQFLIRADRPVPTLFQDLLTFREL